MSATLDALREAAVVPPLSSIDFEPDSYHVRAAAVGELERAAASPRGERRR